MIGQYLSNKNENATIAESKKFSELNKALDVSEGYREGVLKTNKKQITYFVLKLQDKSIEYN